MKSGETILTSYLLSDKYSSSEFVKNKQKKMYTSLKILVNKLDQHSIPYFLVAGSLLRVCRNNRIIPYDNDIDIGIMDNQIDKLKK